MCTCTVIVYIINIKYTSTVRYRGTTCIPTCHVLLLLFYEFCEEQKNEDAGVGTTTVVHTQCAHTHTWHGKSSINHFFKKNVTRYRVHSGVHTDTVLHVVDTGVPVPDKN